MTLMKHSSCKTRRTNRARRLATISKELPGHNTLFEYAFSPDTNLSVWLLRELGLTLIRLSLGTLDLLNKQHAEQLHGQIAGSSRALTFGSQLPCTSSTVSYSLRVSIQGDGSEYKKHLRAEHKRAVRYACTREFRYFQTVIQK